MENLAGNPQARRFHCKKPETNKQTNKGHCSFSVNNIVKHVLFLLLFDANVNGIYWHYIAI